MTETNENYNFDIITNKGIRSFYVFSYIAISNYSIVMFSADNVT